MKRILQVILLFFFSSFLALAETDEQVMKYIQSRYSEGADQRKIATELVARGVSQAQLLRVKSKLEKLQQQQNGISSASTSSDDRMRQANEDLPMSLEMHTGQPSSIFGHDIFRSEQLSFEPNMNVATPANYVLGAGDKLNIDVFGASETSMSCTVSPDGNIVIDGCGPIYVAGMTMTKATATITNKLSRIFMESDIHVSLGQTRSIRVSIMGEVNTPGSYTVSAFATVFHALYLAGGVNELGTMRDVRLYRDNKVHATIDVYEYVMNGKMAGNETLQEGDVIMVGSFVSQVKINGEVKRPMTYEMKAQETLADLLRYCGGLTSKAHKDLFRIERTYGAKRSVYNVAEADVNSFYLMDGDSVIVDGFRDDRYENMVDIQGAVVRPGHYQISSSRNSIKQIIEDAGGLEEQALAANAVLYHMQDNRTLKAECIDIEAIFKGQATDIKLQNEDQLYIPSQRQILERQVVSIFGDVFSPGEYPYAEKETIEALITRAGGLLETASTLKVEVARRRLDPNADKFDSQNIESFSVPINDGVLSKEGASSNFELHPFDIVYVRRSPMSRNVRSARIEGEVVFAGSYPIAGHDYKLSDLIRQAGGVTDLAYINNARLERRRTKEEMEVLANIQEQLMLNNDDSISLNRIAVDPTYQVGIRLAEAINNPGGDEDIILRDGDRLIVPELNAIVSVGGEVQTPNTILFQAGKKAKYYVREAGGYTESARRRKGYVIFPNGVHDRARRAKIEPGCQIVIPAKEKREVNIERTSRMVSISTSVITACAVIISVLK